MNYNMNCLCNLRSHLSTQCHVYDTYIAWSHSLFYCYTGLFESVFQEQGGVLFSLAPSFSLVEPTRSVEDLMQYGLSKTWSHNKPADNGILLMSVVTVKPLHTQNQIQSCLKIFEIVMHQELRKTVTSAFSLILTTCFDCLNEIFPGNW